MKLGWSVVAVTMVSSLAGAQSGKAAEGGAMSTMAMTYTGCIESINHGASFMLTHVAGDGMGAMHHEMPMKSRQAMMKTDDPDTRMKGDSMAPNVFKLTGASNLRKQVGKKVTVTGTVAKDSMSTMESDPPMLTVKSLKVIAKACS